MEQADFVNLLLRSSIGYLVCCPGEAISLVKKVEAKVEALDDRSFAEALLKSGSAASSCQAVDKLKWNGKSVFQQGEQSWFLAMIFRAG